MWGLSPALSYVHVQAFERCRLCTVKSVPCTTGIIHIISETFSEIFPLQVFLHLFEQIDNTKLHVLILVPYTHSQSLMGLWSATSGEKDTRMQEIVQNVQKTLKHPEVGNVFIFYQDLHLIPYLEKQNLRQSREDCFCGKYGGYHGNTVSVMQMSIWKVTWSS